nr:hypothetical protein [Oculatella sp. FACHB-28]
MTAAVNSFDQNLVSEEAEEKTETFTNQPIPAESGMTALVETPTESVAVSTIELAAKDVRLVLTEQREQSQILTTKLNILFVTNGALLTSLNISRLMMIPSPFSITEVIGFLISFTLLVRAFLPRQVAVSPNLEDRKFLEKYLVLSPDEYQLQMLVNLTETYNANKQRLDDVSQTLRYAAYATWVIAVVMLMHMVVVYFLI